MGCLRTMGNPLWEERYIYKLSCFMGKQRAVMSTIRCTRSPKREGKKKSQAGRATEASLTLCCPRCPSTAVGKPDPGSSATGPPAASTSAAISASQPWLCSDPYSNLAFTMVKNKSSVCCISPIFSNDSMLKSLILKVFPLFWQTFSRTVNKLKKLNCYF